MSNISKELLYLLRTADDWEEPHNERHLASIPGNVTLLDLHLQLPHDVNVHAFSKYARIFLRGRPLMATREPVSSTFLPKQTHLDQKESLEIFRLILFYSTDQNLSETRKRLISNLIVQKGISNEALRDEIFLQLVNQTIHSGKVLDSTIDVWILLAGCLSAFAPSQELTKYLLKFVSDAKNSHGYGIVCQHKLLQGISSGATSSFPRTYPPCLLEWTAIRLKSCAALSASLSDGVTLKGQVESWTTAEQFASNLLQIRKTTNEFRHGWTVVLKDDRDSYECSGHDYVLDLVGEIEVVPSFPCGVAYFLVSSDLSRSPRLTSNRSQWADQRPHNAHRLRLMPLDVDELPDPTNPTPRPTPPPPVSPRTTSLAPSTPPPPVSPPRQVPQKPTPVVRPPPVEPLPPRDEAMSQASALNKRPDKMPGIISKSCALNNRYHLGSGRGPGASTGQGGQGLSLAREENRMDDWLENVFRDVTDDDVRDLRNSMEMERRMKGGGDELTAQFTMPMAGGLGYGLSPFGMQNPLGANLLSPPVFSQPILTQPLISQPALVSNPLLGPTPYQSPFLPQQRAPAVSGLAPSYLYQPPAQPTVVNQNYHTAELQAILQQQELEKRVIQSSIETELLKSQLNQVKERTTPIVSTREPVTRQQISSNSTRYPSRKSTASNGAREPIEYDDEDEVDTGTGYQDDVRSARTRQGVTTRPVVVSEPTSDRKRANKSVPNGSKTGSEDQQLHSILKNSISKGVNFSNDVVMIPDTSKTPSPTSPTPPTLAPVHLPRAEKETLKNGDDKAAAGKMNGSSNGPSKPPGAPVPPSAVAPSRVVSGAIGSQRRPPVKIGQIIWPPKQDKEEDPRSNYEPGKLMIDEVKQKTDVIQKKDNPEEIQKKINDKIQMARRKASETEEGEERQRKPAPFRKRPALPSNESLSPTALSPRDSGINFEEMIDNYHTLDMKTRQRTLERQLAMVSWGTQGRKDEPPKAPRQEIPAGPVPSPPPLPPTMAPPPVEKPEVKQEILPFDLNSMDNIRTVLYAQCTDPFYTYANVQWALEIRKEHFSPLEKLSDPHLVFLVFCQIVLDVSAPDCIRLSSDDRSKMVTVLDKFNVRRNNITGDHSMTTMTGIIDAAKALPIYFSRLFAVNGGRRNQKLQMIAIGHSGIRLLTRKKDIYEDRIEVLEHIGFQDIEKVTVPKEGALLIQASKKHFAAYTPQVNLICEMIEKFRNEHNKVGKMPGISLKM